MTLPLALVAGIPLGIYQRTRQHPLYDGWDVRTIPSQSHGKCDFSGISKRVFDCLDEAETSSHDGVHLFIAHDGDRGHFKQDLRSKCYRCGSGRRSRDNTVSRGSMMNSASC